MDTSIEKLYQLLRKKAKAKLGIDKIQKAYQLLNYPASGIPIVHVAGTNGKGSVCNKIAHALSSQGYKVGLFTSPHISSIRERITIDWEKISEEDLEYELEILFKKFTFEMHFFEILTLVSLQYFSRKNVDIIVLEVGLGGRLDATNIVQSCLSVITSIGYDHMHILGDSLEKIAEEKAGIIKFKTPVVLGPHANYPQIIRKAKKLLSPISKVVGKYEDFEKENQAIAKSSLELFSKKLFLSYSSIEKGIAFTPPCRMEVFLKKNMLHKFSSFPKAVVLDVAHNIDGLKQLKKALNRKFKSQKFIGVLGLSKDKDIPSFCAFLSTFIKEVHLAQSSHERLQCPKSIAKHFSKEMEIFFHQSFASAMCSLFCKEQACILACGSFFIMQEIRRALQIEEPQDDKLYYESI